MLYKEKNRETIKELQETELGQEQREAVRETEAKKSIDACADLVAWEVYCRGLCEAQTEDKREEGDVLFA